MSDQEQFNSVEIENKSNLKSFSQTREARAKLILQKGNPELLEDNSYLVPSQYSDKKYLVTFYDTYSCNCKDFQLRCKGKGLYCKHIKTILLFKKLKNPSREIDNQIEFIINSPKKDICPNCSHEEIFKRGKRKTKLGVKQLFCCKKCKKRFVLEPIKNIKGNAKIVCLAMDCYYKGLSYRDISDQFKQFYNLNISHVSIRNWVLRFSKQLDKYSKTLTPKTCGVWNADETMVLTKRGVDKKKPNANYDYLWNVMDNKTKFLLASINSGRSRNKKDAQKVMTDAYKQNVKMPNQIITDKLKAYQDGVRKTFRNWGNERKVKHTSIMNKRHIVNNNAVENLHTHQKEMLKVRRGVKEVQNYADGFKVFHNFVRKDVKNKTTPADKCGIGVDGNRWNTLLMKSIKQEKATQLTGEQKMKISH
jgi:transposase-like protein